MNKNDIQILLKKIIKISPDINNLIQQKIYSDEFILKCNHQKNIKISFVIMTFNEERVIQRCINSIINIADEIIVIDTGSTDSTVDIIQKTFNTKVQLHFLELNDNFSNIRNTLTSFAKNEWVFQIDADEYLGDISQDELQVFLALYEEIDIEPKIISPILRNHDGSIVDNTKRIYKKNIALKYYGRVHEELRFYNEPMTPYLIIDIPIYHDGYMDEIIKSKQKYQRNIALLEKEILEEIDNPRWYYFLAREKKYMNYENQLIISTLEKGLRFALQKRHEYILGLLNLYTSIPNDFPNYPLLYKAINIIKTKTPNCIDTYYYELQIKSIEIMKKIFEESQSITNSITELNETFSFIDNEGNHIFLLLGLNYIFCQQYDLSYLMLKNIQSEKVLHTLRIFLNELNNFINNIKIKKGLQ